MVRVSLVHPYGGHIGSEDDGQGPKQPELFDIHVMIFAGDPESTIEGLARHFAIDRSAAERLVNDVPVVVKRAAEPDVAAEMVDVLGELGAQVVLLPAASAVPPETDLLELKTPSEPAAARTVAPLGELDFDQNDYDHSDDGVVDRVLDQRADRADGGGEWSDGAHERHARARGAATAETWGGLDHNLDGAAPRAALPRATPRRAATEDLLSSAPMAELDLDLSGAASDPEGPAESSSSASLAKKALQGARANPAAQRTVRIAPASLPPERGAETDDGLVIAPLYEAHEREQARSLHDERAQGHSLPPAAPAPSDLGLGSVPPLPDLGLGAVPRLPAMPGGQLPPIPVVTAKGKGRGAPPPPPPSHATAFEAALSKPAFRTGTQAESQRGFYERTLEADAGLKLPSLTAVQTTETRAAARPAQADGYWSGRRAASAADASDTGTSAGEADSSQGAASAAGANANSALERAAPVRPNPAARPADRPSAVVAVGGPLLEVVAGVAVFAIGAMQDSSILFGNASLLSTLVHGIALYGIGAGLWGLRG